MMKKALIILALVMLLFVGAVSASSNGLENGYGIDGTTTNAGSSTNPYAINDLADLQAISSSNWGTGVYYQQTADITLTTNVAIGTGFIGIYNGNGYAIDGDSTYTITFIGNSYSNAIVEKTKIVGMYFNNFNTNCGLFAVVTCRNCLFENNNLISTALGISLFSTNNGNSGIITNCISKSNTITGAHTYDTRYSATFVGLYGASDTVSYTIQNCVAIDGSVSGSSANYRIAVTSSNTLSNNYATSGGSSASGNNGLSITSTQYNSQSWWEDTALYDFSSTGAWQWNVTTQLPELKHSTIITSLVLTSPSSCYEGDTITAYVVSTGTEFQWYQAQGVELTVVYDTSETWDFSSTDSSVTGVSGTAITVTDGTNYYYYAPATDTLGTSLSGGTWQTVYELGSGGYLQSDGASYIDTLVTPSGEFEVESKIEFTSSSVSNLITSSVTYSDYSTMRFYLDSNQKLAIYVDKSYGSTSTATSSSAVSTNAIYKLTKSASNYFVCYVDGVQATTLSVASSYTFSKTLCMFLDWTGGNFGNQKLYYAKYTNNGALVRDYIPILYNGNYALYDKCLSGEVIYDNDGSGSFTGGGTQSALTYTHYTQSWSSISGQTTANLSYTQAPVGVNWFKVIVNDVDSTTKFSPLVVTVLAGKPIINSFVMVYPLSNDMALGDTLQAKVNATSPSGTVTYQWQYSTDNVTYSNLSTTENITYTPSALNTYYFKVLCTANGYVNDSSNYFSPLTITTFNGISNNNVASIDDFNIWSNHSQYYSPLTLNLTADLSPSVSIPTFNGTLLGNSHTLSSLTQPLFSSLSATVSNITIKDSIISTNDYAGALAKTATNATISDIDIENVNIQSNYAGGITGSATDSTITDCTSTLCTIVGTTASGGITAQVSNTNIVRPLISQCDILSPSGTAYGVSP